jgi:hypothetical protein
MKINSQIVAELFEQKGMEEYTGKPRVFRAINPGFFDFLRRTFQEDETVLVLPGVTVEWRRESRLPVIVLEDFRINEDAQFFLGMYGDMLVEEV